MLFKHIQYLYQGSETDDVLRMYYTWHCYQGVLCLCCPCCYFELKYFNKSIYVVDIKSAAVGGTADSEVIGKSLPDKLNSQLGKPDTQVDKPDSQPDKPDSQGSRDSQGSLKSQTSPRKPKVSACCTMLQSCLHWGVYGVQIQDLVEQTTQYKCGNLSWITVKSYLRPAID